MKKYIFIILIVLVVFHSNTIFAENTVNIESVIKEQESSFGIKDFLKSAEKYNLGENTKDLNISEMYNSAVSGNIDNKRLLNSFIKISGIQFKECIKIFINILIIVLIHSILKSVVDGLDNNGQVSNIVYYVQYILIITIIMSSFSNLISDINETIKNLADFANTLIPLLISLLIFTGNLATSSMVQPILLLLIEIITEFIKIVILPIISIITVFIILSKISDKVQINKISSFMKSSVVWTLGIVLTFFIGFLSLEGTLTASVDGITAKTTKAAVSSLIPVVGKILGDGVDSILGCAVVLKNAVGVIGVIIIIGICINPILKVAFFSIMYSLLSAIIEPISDKKISNLLQEMSSVFKLLFGVLCTVATLLIIGITIVIKISNSGMMYR